MVTSRDAVEGTDAGLYWCVVIVRSLLLGQALAVTVVAWSSDRRAGVNLVTLAVAVVETAVLFLLLRRHPSLNQPWLIWVDVGSRYPAFLPLPWQRRLSIERRG